MNSPSYAANTSVSVEKTKAELDTLLGKHGAGARALMHDADAGLAALVFVLDGRKYKLTVPMPTRPSVEAYPKGPDGKYLGRPPGWAHWSPDRREAWAAKEHDQATRSRWRAVLLLTKAKLEIVRMGGSTFEREFLADLVLPNGRTAGEELGEYMQGLLKNGYTAPLALPEAT